MAMPASAPQGPFYTYKAQTPVPAGGHLGFQPGRGYYIKSPGAGIASAAVADPYSALSGYQPLTNAQIMQEAQGEISPIIQAITGQANTQAQTQAQQIQALTQDYANELGQIDMGAPYQQAEGQQAAVDAALQQSLTGGGSSLAAGLQNELGALKGSSGGAALSQAANGLSSLGRSNGTTALANGSASLSNLIANAAAGGEFGQKMPLIADLSGMQALGENSAAQQQTVNNAVLQAEMQLPSIIQNLTANNETALSNATTAAQATAQQNYEKGLALFEQSGRLTPEAAQLMGLPSTSVGATTVGEQNARTAAERAATTAAYQQNEIIMKQAGIGAANARAAAALKASGEKVNASASKSAGFFVNNDGKPILDANGKRIPIKASAGAVSPTGVKITATTLADAGKLAEDLYHGVTKPTASGGTEIVSYSQTYQDAIKTMADQYPELGLKRIMQLVNRWYPAGGKFPDGTPNGRPAAKG